MEVGKTGARWALRDMFPPELKNAVSQQVEVISIEADADRVLAIIDILVDEFHSADGRLGIYAQAAST